MSGIVGIVNIDGAPVNRDLLDRMTEFLAYRGPDAQHVWSDDNVGFGHTMLRTTYEAVHELQPFSLDRETWISADARVDGRGDLIRKLGRPECEMPETLTDAALILLAYRAWDTRCVEYLIGDYAFAIWDGRKKRLFCARDHFGVKPFFYAHVANALVFSNTLDCLRLYPNVSDKLNDVAIADFLLFGVNQDPASTTFADIGRLPGAHCMTCEDGHVRTSRYWSLPVDGHLRYRNPWDYVDHFKEHLRTAVGDRLRTNRVSCEMSGGLDSPAIAATAKAILAQRGEAFELHAHTVVYDRLIPDQERHFAGLTAQSLGIPIHYLVADDYLRFELAATVDGCEPEPFHVGPLAAVGADFRKQMATRARVALTGWDGDALMCESPRLYFRALFRRLEFGRLTADVGWYIRSKHALPPIGVRTWIKRKLGKYPVRSVYPSWIDPSFASRTDLRARWERVNSERPPAHPTRPQASHQLFVPNWWLLLESYDAGVTRLALEARHPLIDLRLVNYILAIPPVPWCADKHILREAMASMLPEPVLRRPKAGLAGNPLQEQVRKRGVRGLELRAAPADMDQYVVGDPTARLGDVSDSNALWANLRPLWLGRWLDDQRSRTFVPEGVTRGRMPARSARVRENLHTRA